MWNFKRAGVIGWLVGISALTCLAIWSGIDAIGQAIVGVGWGILLIVAARAATIAAAGAGWWLIFPPPAPVSLGTCVLLRFVRAAANDLLPLSQVGGDFI